MERQNQPTQKRGLTAIDGALALIALLLIVQMWLLTATLESYLAGHREVVLPAAIISGALFLVCAGLYLFVRRIDAEARAAQKKEEAPML
ncbi:conserved hypothetical protein [Verrucomicrobia bacterium]|nr:conserved hypothetical protein [Verrucomicrobiota bacterium]